MDRLRERLRKYIPKTLANAAIPNTAPATTAGKTQLPIIPDAHSFTAPSAAADMAITTKSLIQFSPVRHCDKY
ncbi:MAG: hypothetical protein HQ446_06970 [Polaromonas sp.]|nr:hypothetical protein [Polaromonas sp.]